MTKFSTHLTCADDMTAILPTPNPQVHWRWRCTDPPDGLVTPHQIQNFCNFSVLVFQE
jgi:hypothetical protein